MAMLLIGAVERAAIRAAIERARQHPLTLDFLRRWSVEQPMTQTLKLADRKPGMTRPPSEQVLIPVGYRAAVSFEEQPAGMAMHLSISAERPNAKLMPSVPVVAEIAKEFGLDFEAARRDGMVWLEEYEPERHAVNILVVTSPKQEGQA